MKKSLLFFLLLSGIKLNAQTGIGTTTPAVKLHVKSNGPILRLEGTDHSYMELYPQGSSTRFGYFGFPSASSTQLTMMNNNASGTLVLGTNNTSRLTIDASGNTTLGGNLTGTTSSSTISNFASVMNDQNTGFTLANSDNGKIITINSSSASTITVPSLTVGFNCMIVQKGSGQITLSASGVTINNRYGFTKTAGQYSMITLVCIASGVYIASGDMTN